MRTLEYTSLLGVLCMLAEMVGLRKFVIPLCVAGLCVIFGLNVLDWGPTHSYFMGMVVTDNFAVVFSGLLILLAILIVVLSANFYKNDEAHISDYLAIIIFTLAGAIAMVSFGNLVMFFLGIEVLSISLYILAATKKKDIRSNEAGMKYFLMGSFASGILLFGIALVYAEVGTFDIGQINALKAVAPPSVLFKIGVGLIMVALFFKVSAAPFHFWAPDVYDGSPTLITVIMATIAKIAAFAAFYRLFSACFLMVIPMYAWIFSAVAALTLIIGNFTALNQDSFKRMLAFSGISHAGYMMIAIMTAGGKTANALFYYSLAYGISTVAAFAVAIVIANNYGSDKIESFNGLGKRKPWLAGSLTIAMLSLAGIPPFAGFFAKYYIFSEAIRNGRLFITILGVISSIVAVYYYFKVILAMYTKESDEVVLSIKPSYIFIISVCVFLIILIGIFPSVFSGFL